MTNSLSGKTILLIIGGGIAAYKCLDLIRRLRDEGAALRVVMTKAAGQFVTPLAVGALNGGGVFTDLFDLGDEQEIGHIRLARETDMVLVAPATADLMAKMAGGHADDLATTVLMASDKPVLVAPAMNPKMWLHPATQRNVAQLEADGINFCGPEYGEMAESGETGLGRMSEVEDLVDGIKNMLAGRLCADDGPLDGHHVLVTAGPTIEPIDPVRYIANRSSGKQGYAIAAAAARQGAKVTLVSGPVGLSEPDGVNTQHVETAEQMLDAVRKALPADIAIFAAAVADWRVAEVAVEKIKKAKAAKSGAPQLALVENPDILRTISNSGTERPALVIGFAAETQSVVENARKKLKAKGCDLIVANDVSAAGGVLGGEHNAVHIVSAGNVDSWPQMTKSEVADRLVSRVVDMLANAEAAP